MHELVLADPGTIPKTSSGKRQRSTCRELYIGGQLKPATLAIMNHADPSSAPSPGSRIKIVVGG